MIKEEANRLVREQKIDISMVVREEWEMKILQVFFDTLLGSKVFFKGGTALRLGYGSPRFSEDLDFTIIADKKIEQSDLVSFITRVTKTYPEAKVSDNQVKFNTILIEFKISDPLLTRNFALKIEISTRVSKYQYQTALLTSPTTNIQVLAIVEKLEDLLLDKTAALADRGKSRDLFDIWYICQKLKQPLPKELPKVDKREIRQELNRFLPMSFATVVKEMEDRYGL